MTKYSWMKLLALRWTTSRRLWGRVSLFFVTNPSAVYTTYCDRVHLSWFPADRGGAPGAVTVD